MIFKHHQTDSLKYNYVELDTLKKRGSDISK